MQLSGRKKNISIWHDMRRDWQRWSPLERLMAGALTLGTLVTAALTIMSGA